MRYGEKDYECLEALDVEQFNKRYDWLFFPESVWNCQCLILKQGQARVQGRFSSAWQG